MAPTTAVSCCRAIEWPKFPASLLGTSFASSTAILGDGGNDVASDSTVAVVPSSTVLAQPAIATMERTTPPVIARSMTCPFVADRSPSLRLGKRWFFRYCRRLQNRLCRFDASKGIVLWTSFDAHE
jgi:hypothetical protein